MLLQPMHYELAMHGCRDGLDDGLPKLIVIAKMCEEALLQYGFLKKTPKSIVCFKLVSNEISM
jgi:hypothetical protein